MLDPKGKAKWDAWKAVEGEVLVTIIHGAVRL